jgi:hypothetical protein
LGKICPERDIRVKNRTHGRRMPLAGAPIPTGNQSKIPGKGLSVPPDSSLIAQLI